MNAGFEFDFDEWAGLAQRDPAEFERRRDLAVDACCERLGGRDKPTLSGIRWRIDQERKRSASPMQLCLKLSSLMWQRHLEMHEWIDKSRHAIRRSQDLADQSVAAVQQLQKKLAAPELLLEAPPGLPVTNIFKMNVVTDK